MSQFGFRASPNTQSVVSSAPSQSPTTPTMAVTGGSVASATSSATPPGAAPASAVPTTATPQRCCDTGRPIFTDPITGQTVCSCQYDLLGYQRLAGGVPGIPALSMYSAPYPEGMAAYFPALGGDQPPFYTPTAAGLELKENLAGATWPYPSMYHPYDAAFAGYPFNGYGMDLNGARRKNATRETTSTLKAWLNEHKKNPYPTKGEKIMLAIITKMTLTQVSTWFANARRRLKKENKMTWEPRNRVEDEDNNNDDDDHKSTDGKDLIDSKDSGTGSSEDGDRPPHPRLAPDTGSEWSESRPDSGPDSPECIYDRPPHPAYLPQRTTSPPPPGASSTSAGKPRIWSLADMASKESDGHTQSASSAFYSTASGRLMPPIGGSRLPPPGLHTSPYSRPEFYRSLYGPGGSNLPSDVSLLENYSRNFGVPTSQSNPLSSVISKAALAASSASHQPGLPLGLTTANARVSPSSTVSSVSSASEGAQIQNVNKAVALNKA